MTRNDVDASAKRTLIEEGDRVHRGEPAPDHNDLGRGIEVRDVSGPRVAGVPWVAPHALGEKTVIGRQIAKRKDNRARIVTVSRVVVQSIAAIGTLDVDDLRALVGHTGAAR